MGGYECQVVDAGKTVSARTRAAGVRKAPRHEIAVSWAPGGGVHGGDKPCQWSGGIVLTRAE
jgi:hypothetical protein